MYITVLLYIAEMFRGYTVVYYYFVQKLHLFIVCAYLL
jgi:hypothetical protein